MSDIQSLREEFNKTKTVISSLYNRIHSKKIKMWWQIIFSSGKDQIQFYALYLP